MSFCHKPSKRQKITVSGKPRIAVFPFSTIDIQGQHFSRFTDRLEHNHQPMDTLTEEDRNTMDDIMLGEIRRIDAEDERAYRANLRERLNKENDRNLALQLSLYDKLLHSPMRPAVIGADYMAAELRRYDTVEVIDDQSVVRAYEEMKKIQQGELFVAKMFDSTGATHILYGIVADLRTKETRFNGYGAQTDATIFELDVLVKMVDVKTKEVVFSGVFTGHDRVLTTAYHQEIDSDRFTALMKSAVAQAAQAIDRNIEQEGK